MAYGGGNFTTYNKVLPGAYINFVSAARATVDIADRGYAAVALALDWAPDDKIFKVTQEDFLTKCFNIFAYEYDSVNMRSLRELFTHAKTVYLYRLNSGGEKAQNDYAKAKYSGTRGNNISIVVKTNVDTPNKKDVSTVVSGVVVDTKTVESSTELKENDFVTFKNSSLTLTSGTSLSGGTSVISVTARNHQNFLDALESYSFNVLGCSSSDETIKKLYLNWTKRMRDEVGAKFQTVIRDLKSDYEGAINVVDYVGASDSLVYWVTGAEASCAVNATLTNTKYDGELTITSTHSQSELAELLKEGCFLFHEVNGEFRVLSDINSLTTVTKEKNEDFQSNQVIRVLDQIGNDIARLFNKTHLGKTRNNESGREALWKDIVAHHQELERIQAIENFDPKEVKVEKGNNKKSVIVTDKVTPVACMEILYMTVVVS